MAKLTDSKLKNIPYRFLYSSGDKMVVRFEKNKLKEVTSKQGTNYLLEVIKNGKLGSASANLFDEEFLVEKALKSSDFGEKVDYQFPNLQTFPKVKLFSQKISSLGPDYFIRTGKFLIDSIREINPDILVDVTLEKIEGVGGLEHSGGFGGEQKATSLVIYVNGDLVSEGDILSIGDFFAWRDQTFEEEKFSAKLKNKFDLAKRIVDAPSGSYSVIFSPDSLSTLLDFVETALSTSTVYRKVSKWVGDLGKEVVDKRLTFTDDPTINFATGSTAFDDEGFAAKPLAIIKNGVLENFYTDLKNAKRLGIKPNGRGFGIPASPSLTNLIVSPGSKPSREMIKEIMKGIWIDQVIGGGQDSPYTGDFSLNIHLGYLIENGEIVGRVKNLMVSGNIFEMLKNKLGEISSDTEWVGGSLNLPYLSFLNINIAGKII